MTEETQTRELERYGNRLVRIVLRGAPSLRDPDDWAASLQVVEQIPPGVEREPETVEVARYDTAHGDVHLDQLYRRGQPKDETVNVDNCWEAMQRLEDSWRRYVEEYEDTHGLE